MKSVSAIIPAHNEASSVADVLSVVSAHSLINETIVVCDNCTDKTEDVARRFPVTVKCISQKDGKGGAMEYGAHLASGKYLFFFDADISGLKERDISDCINAVAEGPYDQAVILRGRGSRTLSAIMKFLPVVGGERIIRKDLWDSIPAEYKTGHRIEPAMNRKASMHSGTVLIEAPHIGHIFKERKWGPVKGFFKRVFTWTDIFTTYGRLLLIRRKL